MKKKSLFSLLTLVVMLVALAACGSKVNKNGVPNILKDKYTGYSKLSGYEYPFIAGGDQLIFDKKENSITNSKGDKTYFSVIPEKDLPPATKGVVTSLKSELKDTENFTIIISREKHPTKKQAEATYQIALSAGGKKIRVIELRRDYAAEGGYYDFSGESE